MNSDPIVILSARRTPVGAFQGVFAPVTGPQLGAAAIKAAVADSGLAVDEIDEVIIGQAPARQAALGAGLSTATPATTVNKMCGSAMRAIMQGADQILAGSAAIIVAGGLESMSNAPYLLPKARAGYRMGHQEVLDHMLYDGLQSPWDGQLMGCFAETTAARFEFSRQVQDDFARESVQRALAAVHSGAFATENAAVTVTTRKGAAVVVTDETPSTLDVAKIAALKPAFKKDGTVTAASSASISDGAAALVLTSQSLASARGLQPLARILGYASFAREPEWFTLAPVGAIQKLLKKLGWRASDVDLYEINEAFAVVTMVATRELGLDPRQVNVNGGACALGHPIGATGARILTTLLHALKHHGKKRGIASLCIGGGEATAIAVELP
jgi:acetyl-CoA C-acetyltransferase